MAEQMRAQRGLYFEDFSVGMALETHGRTIAESDILGFAGISGDFNPMHTDETYAQGTQFRKRVAHGLLGLSIASGLAYQMGFLDGTVIAFTNLEWKFRAPVFIGDTLCVQVKVTKLREMRQTGGGFVTFDVKIVNQDDIVTQKGEWTILVASKPQAAAD